MRMLFALAGGVLAFAASEAAAQQSGGILRITHRDSPASMSIHEEGTISVVLPMMGVFNNLVMFDPAKKQNSLDDIVPDLAEKWACCVRARAGSTSTSYLCSRPSATCSIAGPSCWRDCLDG